MGKEKGQFQPKKTKQEKTPVQTTERSDFTRMLMHQTELERRLHIIDAEEQREIKSLEKEIYEGSFSQQEREKEIGKLLERIDEAKKRAAERRQQAEKDIEQLQKEISARAAYEMSRNQEEARKAARGEIALQERGKRVKGVGKKESKRRRERRMKSEKLEQEMERERQKKNIKK